MWPEFSRAGSERRSARVPRPRAPVRCPPRCGLDSTRRCRSARFIEGSHKRPLCTVLSEPHADNGGPPETLEGWYALHQVFGVPVNVARDAMAKERAANALGELSQPGEGWTVGVRLVGSRADVMLIHFRPTLDSISQAQRRVACESFFRKLTPIYSFLSVAEAGLYHLTAELARAAAARGGNVGDAEYRRAVDARAVSERASAHVQKRLFPVVPEDLPYVCFYPMSKRREERTTGTRSRSMSAAGECTRTGRRAALRRTGPAGDHRRDRARRVGKWASRSSRGTRWTSRGS